MPSLSHCAKCKLGLVSYLKEWTKPVHDRSWVATSYIYNKTT